MKFFAEHYRYEHVQTLNMSEEGAVCIVRRRYDGEIAVIKFTYSETELKILKKLGGKKHIVELLGSLRKVPKPYSFGLVMPKYNGTAESWRGNQQERIHFMHQLFQAIQYCHSKSIVHQDIKPSNILVDERNDCLHVALTDFGLAQSCKRNQKLCDNVGTPQYMAPEVLGRKEYDFSVDIWSAGLVLYELSTGQSLLKLQSDGEILATINNIFSKPEEKKRKFSSIDSEESEFLKYLLQVQSEKRPRASQVLKHPYLRKQK